jgi:DNA-binding NtrC family response regulator
MKALMKPEERRFAKTIARLSVCNHFLPERIALEREALGAAFVEGPSAVWNVDLDSRGRSPNIQRLAQRTETVVGALHGRILQGRGLAREEVDAYEALVHFHLYQRFRGKLESLTVMASASGSSVTFFKAFAQEALTYLQPMRASGSSPQEVAHLFAGLWQIERAFVNIFQNIVGSSPSIARLRASVWESVFTSNFARYRQGLFQSMHQITTLITGPSGTGKELVAHAIAASGYIPFDAEKQGFALDHRALFYAINLAALPSSLLESELFGHKRGAFTGALQDHAGWLEVCPEGGAVFLDEVGEIDAGLQVKLLRVLQTRTFYRLGENQPHRFLGKIIAATNRNLVTEMQSGRFREDFYYRLCSDVISTPALCEQLDEAPSDLPRLVRFIARRHVNAEQVEALTAEVVHIVETKLGRSYRWPGNFRELEQCVRNVLVRGRYEPVDIKLRAPAEALAADLAVGRLTAEELLQRYCAIVYGQTHNLEEIARRLKLDRRTVKAKLPAQARIVARL